MGRHFRQVCSDYNSETACRNDLVPGYLNLIKSQVKQLHSECIAMFDAGFPVVRQLTDHKSVVKLAGHVYIFKLSKNVNCSIFSDDAHLLTSILDFSEEV